ncbi:MAG: agmatinase [Bacteroidales bacterium]|nr:agmatinase [Bacteroidales bacterium]
MMKFGGIPDEYAVFERSEIAMLPVPYDATSTWVKGADKGPAAIMAASENMELFDIETGTEVYKKGIYTSPFLEINGLSPEEATVKVRQETLHLLKNGKFPVIIGGNHTVSIGSIFAFAETFDNLTILQVDAHSDLRESYEGSKFNHACVMARAKEKAHIVQVGIRSMCEEEKEAYRKEDMFFAHEIQDSDGWADKALARLKDNVYLTIDLDGFDPSIMPSTGTPEPGGLMYQDVIRLVKKVIAQKNLAGFDVVELCPVESDKSPDFLAAKLIYQILSFKFANKK